MPIRNILVPVLARVAPAAQLDAALKIARRVEGHINAVYLRPDYKSLLKSASLIGSTVLLGPSWFPGPSLSAMDESQRRGNTIEAEARASFDVWRRQNGLASEPIDSELRSTYACWSVQEGPPEAAILTRGRLSDLIVISYPGGDTDATEAILEPAVFDTGRPLLLVPKRVPDDLLRHVVIAWNGSLEATRAVAGALPLLHEAERVSVFTAPSLSEVELGEDPSASPERALLTGLPNYLVWHGIRAGQLHPPANEMSIGATLLQSALEQEATLIIMGAFTRGRVRQLLLGGVTRHILKSATIPVIMAH